ncbi:MAG: uroporphyrinogen decarboxylase family protein [Pseudomonadota bacterium]
MSMTSAERVQTALSHREPDRVPLSLAAAMHPARDLGLTIRQYFSRPEHVVRGQLMLRQKYGVDILCCYPFAGVEMLAWGGEVIYFEDGPPNAGAPVIRRPEDILGLTPPAVRDSPALQGVLAATASLKAAVGDDAPIAGVVVSPFSLPIMQMGFEAYLDLIYERPELVERLLRVNEEFCVAWAQAQLAAGAGAIVYSDPASSPTILPLEIVRRHGLPAARRTMARIGGGVLFHLASGRGLALVEDIAALGAAGISASAQEDLAQLKAACRGRLALVGDLNALAMRHWSPQEAEAQVKRAIAQAGAGGGFVLSDNHGEIPFLVEDEVLVAISEAVQKWGRYPLDWVASHAG